MSPHMTTPPQPPRSHNAQKRHPNPRRSIYRRNRSDRPRKRTQNRHKPGIWRSRRIRRTTEVEPDHAPPHPDPDRDHKTDRGSGDNLDNHLRQRSNRTFQKRKRYRYINHSKRVQRTRMQRILETDKEEQLPGDRHPGRSDIRRRKGT